MAIDDKSKEYEYYLPEWNKITSAINGKKALVEADMVITPSYRVTTKNAEKVRNRKRDYLERGRYLNATGKTVATLSGMVFEKEPEIIIPSQMNYIYESAGSNGSGIYDIAQKCVNDVISLGRIGLFVDAPTNDKGQTIYEVENGVNVPQITTYKADQIFYWYTDGELQEVRLYELYSEVDGLARKEKKQIRRLVLIDGVYVNQVWREGSMYSETTPTSNSSTLNYIPFFFAGAEDNSANVSKPLMYDLADYNIGHFVLDCDNRENLHYHGQGMTNVYTSLDTEAFTDANPNGLDVGAKGVNQLQQGDKVEVLQIQATGAISAEMDRDEKRMIMLGAQLVIDSGSTATLGAKEMEFSSSISTLKRVSINCSKAIESALLTIQSMLNVSGEVKFELNRDYLLDTTDAQLVATHLQAVVMGKLPDSTFYETARSAGLTNKDDEELTKELADTAYQTTGKSKAEIESELANE